MPYIDPEEPDRPLRGRPRNELAHEAILESARRSAEGHTYGDLSIQSIARDAGVAKSTIYRWWKNKPELIFEALMSDELSVPKEASLQADLRHLMLQYLDRFLDPALAKVYLAAYADLTGLSNWNAPEVCAHRAHCTEVLQKVIHRWTAAGVIQNQVPIEMLVSIWIGTAQQVCRKAKRSDRTRSANAFAELVASSLTH